MKINKLKLTNTASLVILALTGGINVNANANELMTNPSFEDGRAGWNTAESNARIIRRASNIHSGIAAVRVGKRLVDSSAEQIVSGLLPNTTYELRAFARVNQKKAAKNKSTVAIGVKDHGGEVSEALTGSDTFEELVVTFTTGAESTEATVYAARVGGRAYGYADDFSLTQVGDFTAPTVTISSNVSNPTTAATFPITIAFNEAVENFDISDLYITNGSASNFVANSDNTEWSVDITPEQAGMVDISIAYGSATDLAGNDSLASNDFSIEYVIPFNFVKNAGFEDGGQWKTEWNASIITGEASEGEKSVRVGNGGEGGSAEQWVGGLKENTVYRLSADARVGAVGSELNIGVKWFGRDTVFQAVTSTEYENVSMEFATASGVWGAQIFAYRASGSAYGYADNFSVTEVGPIPMTQPDPEVPSDPCLAPVISDGNTNYYIDSATGDDCNDGLTAETAWSSLHKINVSTFTQGDQILLNDQGMWTGVLKPQGSGVAGNHLVISKYGNGDNNQRPIINGNGTLHAVYLHNQEYIEITNLEVINSAQPQAKKRGIEVENVDAGTLNQIHIKNNYVHDIKGDNSKDVDGSAGIMVTVRKGGDNVQSNYDGIFIENNAVVRADRTAINTSNAWWCRPSVGCIDGSGYQAHTNVTIRNNYVEDAGGDGIVPINSESALVEYNLVNGANVNSKTTNVAMWTWNADNTLFQYNEAYNTQETTDGQGFDIDYGQDGTVFQYNYSHDNIGGFFLVATGDWNNSSTTNSVIRYNISQNDHERLFHMAGKADGVKVYNNTMYLPAGSTTKPISITSWGGYPSNVEFYNNIFHLDGAGEWEGLDLIGGTFTFDSSNIIYGSHTAGEPAAAMVIDPMLVAPGTATSGTYSNGVLSFGNFDGYKLQTGSPAIGAGVVIPNAPSVDFWGNAVSPSTPNIGAYAGSGE